MAGTGNWVRIGTVRSVNPARRELRIDPARTTSSGAEKVSRVRVTIHGGETLLCIVENVSANPGGTIVTLGAGIPRDAVARMKGAAVESEKPPRKPAAPKEMAAEDWIGLDVIGADGSSIGVIRGCIESRAHDILEIETPDGKQLMLPAIEQTVESIDLETRRVTVGDIAPYVISNAD